MPRNELVFTVINRQPAIESDAHFDQRSAQFARHAVAVAAHLDVSVPRHYPAFAIGGVKPSGRQRLQVRQLPREALGYHLLDRAVQSPIGFLPQSLLGQLVEMRQALELPVAGEEVLLDVAHHAFVLALGARAPWPAGPR